MKKWKTGAKNCTIGANCKSTCIDRAKNCVVEANKTEIKEAIIKLKAPKIKKSAISNEELTASQKTKLAMARIKAERAAAATKTPATKTPATKTPATKTPATKTAATKGPGRTAKQIEAILKDQKAFVDSEGTYEAAKTYLESRQKAGDYERSKAHADKISIKNGNATQQQIVRDNIRNYTQLTGHYPEIKEVQIIPGRSGMDMANNMMYIRANNNSDAISRTVWHELAHTIELNKKAYEAAKEFRDSNAEGPPRLLASITGDASFKDEKAYESDLWRSNPYIGKVYKHNSTEIYSMGIENLRSADALTKAYPRIPEVMDFVMSKDLNFEKPVEDTI